MAQGPMAPFPLAPLESFGVMHWSLDKGTNWQQSKQQ